MTQAWFDTMVRASWQGALLVGFVWLALFLWRRSTPAARTWLWMIATAKFVLVLLIVVEWPVLAPVAAQGLQGSSLESSITYNYGGSASTPVDWPAILFWAWLLGVAAVVTRALIDHARLKQLAIQSTNPGARVARMWEEVSDGANATVMVHPEAPVPLVFGLFRLRVLLPSRLVEDLSDDELEMVLAHEAAHVLRRDTVSSLYMFACHGLFYFHPAVWLARREWQLDRESACDEYAMARTGADARGYAAMLLKVSAGADRAPVLALSAVPTYRTLQRRINEMKQPKNDLRSGRAVWALLALLVSAGAVPVVLTQRQPNFGAGVFETKWPEVKVSQALKGKQAPAEEAVASVSTASSVAMVERATTTVAGPAGLAQVVEPVQIRPASATTVRPSSGLVQVGPGVSTTQVAPTGGVAQAGPGRPTAVGPVTTIRPTGRATYSGEVATVTVTGPVAQSGAPGGTTVIAPQTGAPGATTAVEVPVKVRDGAIAVPMRDTMPSSVTIVLKDKQAKGGSGLDTLVSIDLDDVAVTDFFKFLSSITKVKIVAKGLRSGMRLNAQIENTTLGEVMGTLAKVYKLEWRLEGDGSITVQPI